MARITKKEMVENVKNTLATTNQTATQAVDAVIEVILEA